MQKSGELCRYTSSFSRTGRMSMSLGTSCLRVPMGRWTTLVADKYLVFKSIAMSLRSCRPLQHVRMEQEPETPWHLHFMTKESLKACVGEQRWDEFSFLRLKRFDLCTQVQFQNSLKNWSGLNGKICIKLAKVAMVSSTCLPTSLLWRCISLLAFEPDFFFIFMGASENLEPMRRP